MTTSALHQPVLPNDVIAFLAPKESNTIIDATVGCGGHSSLILKANPKVKLIGIDRDINALEEAKKVLSAYGEQVQLIRARFSEIPQVLKDNNPEKVDGILMDIGMSSLQLDTADRGFSLRLKGPLDMRMDSRDSITASQILNSWSEKDIADIFWKYGEEKASRRIAREIVKRRDEKPLVYTDELADLINNLTRSPRKSRLPAATRCFQALRIAVNNELQELEKGLSAAVECLNPKGKLVVISFHSLEDRIVKNFMREQAKECICPPGMPECRCEKESTLKILTKKPVQADKNEIENNRRAACAKLRAAEKI